MPKTKRGRILWKLPGRSRGTCPLCSRTGVKLLYPRAKADGSAVQVCKICSSASQDIINSID